MLSDHLLVYFDHVVVPLVFEVLLLLVLEQLVARHYWMVVLDGLVFGFDVLLGVRQVVY